MDAYPPEYFTTPLPLLIVSGLGSSESYTNLPPYPLLENGTLLSCDQPPVTSKAGQDLLQCFLTSSPDASWKGTVKKGGRPPNSSAFKVVAVGRNFALPPKKANPPASSVPGTPIAEVASPRTPSGSGFFNRPLHSPLSPLSPDSPLYPDGVFSHIWIRKHLYLQPCAFVCFFEFQVADPTAPQPAKEQEEAFDRALASSINDTKKALTADSRKIKLAVVMIAQKTLLEAPSIEDRFALVRRLTGLDTKSSLFFVPARASAVELQQVAKSVELALTPNAIEFYRELSKHARRKRNRSSVPPPTLPPASTSQSLSNTGWTARYEMKLAIFAEFRGEVDVAVRNYETAYEALLEAFETTNNWSPRWTEIRLLADVLSARIIRCHTFLENTTQAARRWETHRRRMGDMLDRRGSGTGTYGWAAWVARWAEIMAIISHDSRIFELDPKGPEVPAFYASMDKTIKIDDKVSPIEHLHHPGFWWTIAAAHTKLRQRRAARIERDGNIDTYLCLPPEDEPKFDHDAVVLGYLNEAASAFDDKSHTRLKARAQLDIAQLEIKKGNPHIALNNIKSSIRVWRSERWDTAILENALRWMKDCALQCSDASTALSASLELHSNALPSNADVECDMARCLEGLEGGVTGVTSLALRAQDILPLVNVKYSFLTTEASVGEYAVSQLVLESLSQPDATALPMSDITVEYKGNLKTVHLKHEAGSSSEDYQNIRPSLKEIPANEQHPRPIVEGSADLRLNSGQTKVFEICGLLREPGDARATSVTLTLKGEGFDIDLMIDIEDENPLMLRNKVPYWWKPSEKGLLKVPLRTKRPAYLKILPKPPRVMVKILKLEDPIYIGEEMKVTLGIVNEEDEDVDASLRIRILGYPDEVPLIKWDAANDHPLVESDPETPFNLGPIAAAEEIQRTFTIPSTHLEGDISLEISSLYHLISDPETPISKSIKLPPFRVRRPFRTKFDFSPSVHPQKWPNMFRISPEQVEKEADTERARGLAQRWVFKCQISLLEDQPLTLEAFKCGVSSVRGGIVCKITRDDDISENGKELLTESVLELVYILEVTKITLEDRRSSDIDLDFRVRWRRTDGDIVETPLAVPRLLIPGSEPRVLAEASEYDPQSNMTTLKYTLENPTMHVLTFSVTMEPSETFNFEGPIQPGVQLMPLSRHVMEYKITPRIRHDWIKPNLRVVDKYYNKNLRIAACEGTKGDKSGLLVWIP